MPTPENWRSLDNTGGVLDETDAGRAAGVGRIIGYKDTEITCHASGKGRTPPGAQTVRIEVLRNPGRVVGEASTLAESWVIVVGYKDHPTIADTDLVRGDCFRVAGVNYTVHAVRPATVGKFEAYCRAVR